MKVMADGKNIPGVQSVYEDHLYLGDTSRRALHLDVGEALSAGAWNALLCGEITAGEGGNATVYEGYNAVHACRVTLLRTDEAERALAELGGRLAAAENESEEAKAALAGAQETRALLARALAPRFTDEEVLAFDPVWPEWTPDAAYLAQEVVCHGGALYRVAQSHTSQAHQQPGGEGMLSIYRPVQAGAGEGAVLPWVSGEEIALGDRRLYDGDIYECIAPGGAGANVHTPAQVASVWAKIGK